MASGVILNNWMRGRSYSYSTSPPRHYARRDRSPSPRGHYGGRGQDLPTSLLVRNLRRDEQRIFVGHLDSLFPLKDIYLPCDYYTGYDVLKISSLEEFDASINSEELKERRGFGFIQYVDPADAAGAKCQMDRQILLKITKQESQRSPE